MRKNTYIGIFREAEHSPDRVEDDELILRAVADRLEESSDNHVRLIFPSELSEIDYVPDLIFYMAEEEPVLEQLQDFARKGTQLVNSVNGVKNTFRKEMTRALSPLSFVPETVITSASAGSVALDTPVWVKRGDYHAIEKDDVLFAKDRSELKKVLDSFLKRGIETVVIQRHVAGDLIKFYGVRGDDEGEEGMIRWFHWFYHKDQELNSYIFSETELEKLCESAASCLRLEIFGGDAIVTEPGEIFIIDVNAWPSFALFRDTASRHIADHIVAKVKCNP